MMMPYNAKLGTIIIKPSVKQWFVDHCGAVSLTLAGYLFILLTSYSRLIILLPIVMTLHLLYQLWFMKQMRFTLSEEILIYEYGVLLKRIEYIELYRIVDFHETISLVQSTVGLKTITLMSGDRTSPRLIIPGIDRNYPLVPIIRDRVETTKQRKRIYEFTNH